MQIALKTNKTLNNNFLNTTLNFYKKTYTMRKKFNLGTVVIAAILLCCGILQNLNAQTCTPPSINSLQATCMPGDELNFYVTVDFTFGSGTSYTISNTLSPPADWLQVTASGSYTIGPFPNDDALTISITDDGDATCFEIRTGVSGNCTPPPPNDGCDMAIAVNCGQTVAGNTDFATVASLPSCGTTITSPGVWYSFEGNGNFITASTCGAADFDTKISVFTGDCNFLTCIEGNDNAAGCANNTSQVSWLSSPGVDYFILVHGFLSETGSFDLTMDCVPPPPNDLCSAPIALACGQTVSGTTNIASVETNVNASICGTPINGPGVWYSTVGDGSTYILSTCGTATFDTRISVFTGSCDIPVCVGGVDNTLGCDNNTSEYFWQTTPGEPYLILIHTGNALTGPFDLSLTCSNCTNPTISATTICSPLDLDNFMVSVEVTLGNGTSYTLSDDETPANSQQITASGVYQMGPYANSAIINFIISNNDDALCFAQVSVSDNCACFAQAGTPIAPIDTVCNTEPFTPAVLVSPPADASFMGAGAPRYLYLVTDPNDINLGGTAEGAIVDFSDDGSYNYNGIDPGNERCFYGFMYDDLELQAILCDPANEATLLSWGISCGADAQSFLASFDATFGPFDVPGVLGSLNSLCMLLPGECGLCVDAAEPFCVEVVDCTPPPLCPIFVSDETSETEICAGGTVDFSVVLDNVFDVSPGMPNYSITWTGPDGLPLPPSTDLSITFAFANNQSCEIARQAVSYFIECIGGTDPPITGSFEVDVYPTPPADISDLLIVENSECATPMVMPISGCEDFITIEAIDPPTFPVGLGEEGTITYAVNFTGGPCCVGGACDYPNIQADYDCPGCPVPLLELPGAYTDGCISATIELAPNVPVDDGTLATYTWIAPDNSVVPASTPITITHSGNVCNGPELHVYKLKVGCTEDPNYEVVGATHVVVVYPEITPEDYILPDETSCSFGIQLADDCGGDSPVEIWYSEDGVDFSQTPPADLTAGQSQSIFYNIFTRVIPDGLPEFGSPCSPVESFTINCPQCPTPSVSQDINGSACAGDDLTISASLDLSGTNPANTDIEWFINGVPTGVTGADFTGTVEAPESCGVESYLLTVIQFCDLDGSIFVLDAGTLTVYGEPEEGVDFTLPSFCEATADLSNCDLTTATYTVNGTPADPDTLTLAHGDEIGYTINIDGAPEGCGASGTYLYDCPVCADVTIITDANVGLCADEPILSGEISLTGAIASTSVIEWFVDGNSQGIGNTAFSTLVDPPSDNCSSVSYNLSARVICDFALSSPVTINLGNTTVYGLPEEGTDFFLPEFCEPIETCAGTNVSYFVDGAAVNAEDLVLGDDITYVVSVDGAPEGCGTTGNYFCLQPCPELIPTDGDGSTSTDLTVCSGDDITLTLDVLNIDPALIEWSNGTTGATTETGPLFNIDDCDGTLVVFTATVPGGTIFGCDDDVTATFNITVLPDPITAIQLVEDGCTVSITGGCDDSDLNITYSVEGGDPQMGDTYTTPPPAADQNDMEEVVFTITNACGSSVIETITNCNGPESTSLSGSVFFDDNENGIWETVLGEPGLEGIMIFLLRASDGMVIATATTGPNGAYAFIGLEPDAYYVTVDLLEDYEFTLQDVGTDESVDSDVDVTGQTPVYTLPPGFAQTGVTAGMFPSCRPNAGELEIATNLVCADGFIEASSIDANTDPEYVQAYILTTGPAQTVIDINFDGMIPAPQMGTYCVFSINYQMGNAPIFPAVGESIDVLTDSPNACYELNSNGCIEIQVIPPIEINVITDPFCLPIDPNNFYVIVEITGGTPAMNEGGSYSLSHVPFVATWLNGSATVTMQVANGTDFIQVIDDGSGCTSEALEVMGSCECVANPGELPEEQQNICDGDFTDIQATGSTLGPDDVLAYYLTDTPGSVLGNIFAMNSTGQFSSADVPSTATVYYVHAVAGPDLDGDGFPELDNECTFVALTATPVLFYAPINAAFSNEKGATTFKLLINLFGGGSNDVDHLDYTLDIQVYYQTIDDVINLPLLTLPGNLSATVVTPNFPFEVSTMNYTITITDADGCQGVFFGEVIETVPIELINFDGEARTDGNFLQWTTASEINNSHFTLYHSTDGNNFAPITSIEGAGNSVTAATYNFLHTDAPTGLSYYRLAQTDFDGSSQFVGTISLERSQYGFTIVEVTPVPAQDVANILFTTDGARAVEMNVYDVSGRLVDSQSLSTTNGMNQHSLNVSNYPAGVYIVRMTDGIAQQMIKLVKE